MDDLHIRELYGYQEGPAIALPPVGLDLSALMGGWVGIWKGGELVRR